VSDGAPSNGTTSNGTVPAEVTVIIGGRRHAIAYQAGDTLLLTARRGGLAPPTSCEAGNCGTCMALLHEGDVTMRCNHVLTDDDLADGYVLTCQGVPHGSTVVIEYESF